jgi:cytochrome P450
MPAAATPAASAAIAGFDGGLLSVRERDALIFGCLAAGRETTAAAVTAVFVTGWQHRLLGQAWRMDPAWRAGFCCEVLRLSTPWPVTTLAAAAPVRFGAVTAPADGRVELWWPAANLDPAEFPGPHRLDPARPGAAGHLAFGAGIHACTGRHLALAAMPAAMDGLLPVLHSGARLAAAQMSTGLIDGWTRAVFTRAPALAAPFLKGPAVTAPG